MDNPASAIIVDLVAVAIIIVMVLLFRKLRWFIRIPLATLLGWTVVIAGVALHWRMMWLATETESDRAWVAMHDSGPLTFSWLFGWLFALIIVLLTESAVLLTGVAKRGLRTRNAA